MKCESCNKKIGEDYDPSADGVTLCKSCHDDLRIDELRKALEIIPTKEEVLSCLMEFEPTYEIDVDLPTVELALKAIDRLYEDKKYDVENGILKPEALAEKEEVCEWVKHEYGHVYKTSCNHLPNAHDTMKSNCRFCGLKIKESE